MIRKMLLLAGVLVALLAAPAVAQYSPSFVAPSSAAQGQAITISGTGGTPGATINFFICPASDPTACVQVGSAVVAADGTYSAQVTVPSNLDPGQYLLKATGAGINRTMTIGVQAASGGTGTGGTAGGTGTGTGSGALPRTGSNNLQPLTIAGALLVATGGLLILATRKHRRHAPVVA